jgi:hypothetical protein
LPDDVRKSTARRKLSFDVRRSSFAAMGESFAALC